MKKMHEGVIKFTCHHTTGPLPTQEGLPGLLAWRKVLHALGMIGQNADRYQGYGFGNISVRPGVTGDREKGFLITGTQTGAPAELTPKQCVWVSDWDTEHNELASQGTIRPSSESLTHGVLYELQSELGCVMHAHCPEIWQYGPQWNIPVTRPEVAYGTPAMADEVRRLWQETDAAEKGIFIMGGHEDGVVSYGNDAQTAGKILVDHLARAYADEYAAPQIQGNSHPF